MSWDIIEEIYAFLAINVYSFKINNRKENITQNKTKDNRSLQRDMWCKSSLFFAYFVSCLGI